MTRDRIENAIRRLHSAELSQTTVDVYEPTESYSQSSGYDVSYPGSATTSGVDARAEPPADQTDRDAGGTTTDHDRVYLVRDDSGVSWTDFGASGQAATRFDDTDTGDRYEVVAVLDERDGLVRLACSEVAT